MMAEAPASPAHAGPIPQLHAGPSADPNLPLTRSRPLPAGTQPHREIDADGDGTISANEVKLAMARAPTFIHNRSGRRGSLDLEMITLPPPPDGDPSNDAANDAVRESAKTVSPGGGSEPAKTVSFAGLEIPSTRDDDDGDLEGASTKVIVPPSPGATHDGGYDPRLEAHRWLRGVLGAEPRGDADGLGIEVAVAMQDLAMTLWTTADQQPWCLDSDRRLALTLTRPRPVPEQAPGEPSLSRYNSAKFEEMTERSLSGREVLLRRASMVRWPCGLHRSDAAAKSPLSPCSLPCSQRPPKVPFLAVRLTDQAGARRASRSAFSSCRRPRRRRSSSSSSRYATCIGSP